MNRTGRLVAGAVLIGLGLITLLAVVGTGPRETTRQVFDGVTAFFFDAHNSPIQIVAGQAETIVEADATTGSFGARVDLEQDGGTLRLVQRCPIFPFGIACQADLRVTVPAEVDVSGTTSNGAISATGLSGTLDVESSNGSITLADLSAFSRVQTSNGSIVGTGLVTATLDARTSNGSVDVDFRSAPTSVRIETSNGSIELRLPSDSPPYRLSTSTSNGRVSTDVRTDPASTQTIDVQTSNGDISVRYAG